MISLHGLPTLSVRNPFEAISDSDCRTPKSDLSEGGQTERRGRKRAPPIDTNVSDPEERKRLIRLVSHRLCTPCMYHVPTGLPKIARQPNCAASVVAKSLPNFVTSSSRANKPTLSCAGVLTSPWLSSTRSKTRTPWPCRRSSSSSSSLVCATQRRRHRPCQPLLLNIPSSLFQWRLIPRTARKSKQAAPCTRSLPRCWLQTTAQACR